MTSFTQSRQRCSAGHDLKTLRRRVFFVTLALMILTVCLGGLEGMYVEGWTFVEAFTHGSLHFPLWATVTTFPDGLYF